MNIAIIGSGISGLTAAYLLAERHAVTLIEASTRLGGHTNTVPVSVDGRDYALDTGFLVYNERTYPLFTRLLSELGVATQPSEMSFSVRSDVSGWEYCGSNLRGLFAQRQNLVRPAFYRMLRDILRFNRQATKLLAAEESEESLEQFVRRLRFRDNFLSHYLLPMGAAIWSAPPQAMLRFPAQYFARFFANHGLLALRDRPPWRTVTGGAARYIEAMRRSRQFQVRLGQPVRRVSRGADGVAVECQSGPALAFDQVVIATHAPQALRMLTDCSPHEREILGAFRYQPNEAVLHTDGSLLPRRAHARASWNYHVSGVPDSGATVTYWLNRLQQIDAPCDFCVTLNGGGTIDPARVLARIRYEHPLYSRASFAAQRRRLEISGRRRTHYCGAYWGYGFHEDGVRSAWEVVKQIESESQSCTPASTKARYSTAATVR